MSEGRIAGVTAKGWSLSAYRERFQQLFPAEWEALDERSVAEADATIPDVAGNDDWARHPRATDWLLLREDKLDEFSGFTDWWNSSGDPRSMDEAIRKATAP